MKLTFLRFGPAGAAFAPEIFWALQKTPIWAAEMDKNAYKYNIFTTDLHNLSNF